MVSQYKDAGRVVGGEQSCRDNSGLDLYIMSANSFAGENVVDFHGDDLGKIDAIMLDVPYGRIAYAVLSCGELLDMGDKLFAIPWNAFSLDADRGCFVLDADKSRLKKAPWFGKERWPTMADVKLATKIHSYYGPMTRLE